MPGNSWESVVMCNKGCGTRLVFDKTRVSDSGKVIPLDYNTKQPHQCPNSKFKKQTSQYQVQQNKAAKDDQDIERIIRILEMHSPMLERILAILEDRTEQQQQQAATTKSYSATDMILDNVKDSDAKIQDQNHSQEEMPDYGDDNGEYR